MPAQWTGEIVGEMHNKRIKAKDLANAVGWHPKYLSSVLNGHREPKNAEIVLRNAINSIITKRDEEAKWRKELCGSDGDS